MFGSLPRALCTALSIALAACGGEDVATDAGGADAGPTDAGVVDAGPSAPTTVGPSDRPARLYAPQSYDGVTPLPLVLLLHGYMVSGVLQDAYLGVTNAARDEGFYVLMPNGTEDAEGSPHWDVISLVVDDAAYLRALVDETMAVVPVLPNEVYVFGHSNGGFMAYTLACASADLFAGIAALSASDVMLDCTPSATVSVLHIHGTTDTTIPFEGGDIFGLVYPDVMMVVDRWAERAGCDPTPTALAMRDVTVDVDGPETTPFSYPGCDAPAGVELWSMEGGGHIPGFVPGFSSEVVAWLRAHARP